MSNGLAQAVNVYVTHGGTDMFVRQVAAGASVRAPVSGVEPGATVTVKAVTIDGSKTYSRANVVLSGTYSFVVP